MLKSSKGLKRATVVPHPTPVDLVLLEEAVDKLIFRELTDIQEETWGFTAPDDFGTWGALPRVGNIVVLTIRHDRRIPNKSRLSREWHKAIREKEKTESRLLSKAEKQELREDVKRKLFKKTAPTEYLYQAIYDLDKRLFVVTETSATAVDYVIEKINRALEPQNQSIGFSAKTTPPVLENTLTTLVHSPPEVALRYDLQIGTDFRLEHNDCVATLKNHTSDSPEVREHLHRNKMVQQVSLAWKESVHFVLNTKRVISQLDFKAYCKDNMKEAKESGTENLRTYQSATFLVWLGAFYELWEAIENIPTDHENL